MSDSNLKIGFELLGSFRLVLPGQNPKELPPRQTNAVLAYLATYSAQRHSREDICRLFWEDAEAENARASLRQATLRIRKYSPLFTQALVTDDSTLCLLKENLETDLALFEANARKGMLEQDPCRSAQLLQSAFELYRGPFLASFQDEWVLEERTRLEALFETLCEHLTTRLEMLGELERAIEVCTRLLQVNSLQEETHLALMRLHAKRGQGHAVKRHYQTYLRLWKKEFPNLPRLPASTISKLITDHFPATKPPTTHSEPVETWLLEETPHKQEELPPEKEKETPEFIVVAEPEPSLVSHRILALGGVILFSFWLWTLLPRREPAPNHFSNDFMTVVSLEKKETQGVISMPYEKLTLDSSPTQILDVKNEKPVPADDDAISAVVVAHFVLLAIVGAMLML